MTPLWNMLLRADLPSDILEDLHFAVFGLGGSAYEKICWVVKKLTRRLLGLGAQEVCARGEGDEQHPLGAEGALDVWMPQVFSALEALLPPPLDGTIEDPDVLPPPRISMTTSGKTLGSVDDLLAVFKDHHAATVRRNDRITSADWFQDVRHIELDLEDDVIYSPGDVAVIHPIQPSSDVDSFLSSMSWSDIADEEIYLSPVEQFWSIPESIPRRTSLRQLFTRYLDINAVPRRSFFKVLRHFATNEMEKEKLSVSCTAQGANELYEYVTRVRRTIREVKLYKSKYQEAFNPSREILRHRLSASDDLEMGLLLCALRSSNGSMKVQQTIPFISVAAQNRKIIIMALSSLPW
ncbi:hypothetical protein ACEPAG_9451 [Sanghuangporus baumii]